MAATWGIDDSDASDSGDVEPPRKRPTTGHNSSQVTVKTAAAPIEFPEKFDLPKDLKSTDWWVKPLTKGLEPFRLAKGGQVRPLTVVTACSGTEAPLHGLQATQHANTSIGFLAHTLDLSRLLMV